MAGANAYEAARVLIRAVAFGAPNGGDLCSALTRLKHAPVSGTFHGFVKGEIVKSVQVQVVRDGRVRRFATVDALPVITPPTR
ncbi:MAG: hypothetical protein ACRELZ_06580 [Candidatus Rokuibacteriota bacterium]